VVSALASDLRAVVRVLLKAPSFTLLAFTTLTAGMALCVTVVSVVNAYVVRSLPYPSADRMYRIDYAAPGQPPPRGLETVNWRALDDVVEHGLSWDLDVFYMLGGEYPEAAPGAWVTPEYLRGFGVRVAQGRLFDDNDYRAGSAPVAIVSDRVWRTRFGGADDVVGRRFQAYVSDRPDEPETFTIIGVLRADHWHFNAYSEVLAPLKAPSYPYQMVLRAGTGPSAAAERIAAVVSAAIPSLPREWRPALTGTQDSYVAAVRPVLWSVAVAAGLVLLIAAANVAVLLLVRGRRRQKELAMRLALGATPARAARLLVLEGVVLALTATVAGVLIASAALGTLGPAIERVLERRIPGGSGALVIDTTVMAVAAGSALLVAIVFALAPLLGVSNRRLAASLIAGRSTTDGVRMQRMRALLIAIEVAASLTLLAGASLMAESAIRMLRVEFGLHADSVLMTSVSLRQRSYPEAAARAVFYRRAAETLAGLPGVMAVGIADAAPLQARDPNRLARSRDAATEANVFAVDPGYFTAVGQSVRDGRGITHGDVFGGEPVAVVSDALARRLWPRGRAVGQRLTIEASGVAPATHAVVGVVSDVRQSHADTHFADVYLPLAQQAGRFATLFVRHSGSGLPEPELRRAIAGIDAEVAIGVPRPLAAAVEQERDRPRFLAAMLTVFALFSCVVAVVGMYGVIAYAVRQRQREVAVRIAIGADSGSVTRLFMRQSALVLSAGVALGIGGAGALGQVLHTQLHGVRPFEPRVVLLAAAAFAATGLLATWWPARRASRIDPAVLLRDD
jgi:predicted permease